MIELVASLLVDGEPLARDIAVELTTEPHDPDGTRWHGKLKVAATVPLSLGRRCTLRFADGREGTMEVTRLTYGRRFEDIRVFFRGRGRLG